MQEYSKELMEFIKNYKVKYRQYCAPTLRRYETKRIIMLVSSILVGIALILAGCFVLYASYPDIGKGDAKVAGFLIIAGFCSYCIFKKLFEDGIKDEIMGEMIDCFGDFHWSQFYQGDPYAFVKAGLFPNFSSKTYDDVFKCKYKDVNVDIVEGEYTQDGGNRDVTVFDGVVIKLDMNKDFNGHTVLCTKTKFAKSPLKALEQTQLEDVEFNKMYNVYTDDKVEARYILTTVFMEKLKNIKVAFKCKYLRCAFYKKNLYIALSTNQDLFSVGSLIKPVADEKQFNELCEQFVSILALVDILKLDTKVIL